MLVTQIPRPSLMHRFALNAVNVGMKSGNTFVTKLFIVIYPTPGSTINSV